MKHLVFGLLALVGVSAAASPGFPDTFQRQRVIQLSQQLTWELGQFSLQADQQAFQAERFGNYVLSRALRDVAYHVKDLSLSVSREVNDVTIHGAPLYVAARNLQAMQWQFQQTTQLILSLGQLPFQMQATANRARAAHVQLKNVLGVATPFLN